MATSKHAGRFLPGDTITLEGLHAMLADITTMDNGRLKALRAITLRVSTTPPHAPKTRTIRQYTEDDFR